MTGRELLRILQRTKHEDLDRPLVVEGQPWKVLTVQPGIRRTLDNGDKEVIFITLSRKDYAV